MALYLFAGLFLLLIAVLSVRAYRRDKDATVLVVGVVLTATAAFYTGFTRTMLVYKPIMALHIALTLYSWYGVILYLLKRKIDFYALFSPLGTIALFFLVAFYFKGQ